MKYEYCRVIIRAKSNTEPNSEGDFNGMYTYYRKHESMPTMVNQLGNEGWLMCGSVNIDNTQNDFMFIFYRVKEPEQEKAAAIEI